MVTGPTAAELQEQNKDPKDAKAIVVVGSEMETFVEADWERVFSHKEVVFARAEAELHSDIDINCRICGVVYGNGAG